MLRILYLIFLLMSVGPVHADYATAAAAFNSWNYPKAASEFRPLAEQGDARAQFYLGYLYDEGKGVPQDDNQARYWYAKSAAQGIQSAKNNLSILETKLKRLSANEAPIIDFRKQCLVLDGDLTDITATNFCGVPVEARYCFYDDARFTSGDLDKTCQKNGLWTTGLLQPNESIQIFEAVSRPRTADGTQKAKFYFGICDMSKPESKCVIPPESPPFALLGMEGIGQKERAIAKLQAERERKLAKERESEATRQGLLATAGAVVGAVVIGKATSGKSYSDAQRSALVDAYVKDRANAASGVRTNNFGAAADSVQKPMAQGSTSGARTAGAKHGGGTASLKAAPETQSWRQCGPEKKCLIGDGLKGFCSGPYDPKKPMCKSECSMDSSAFYHDTTLKPGAYIPGAGNCPEGSCNVVNSCN